MRRGSDELSDGINSMATCEMMRRISLEHLHRIASAEGEGLGTAYEYLAKWNLLETIFDEIGYKKNILIAGLPEKYGLSMDFVLFSMKYRSRITVIDERDEVLRRFKKVLKILGAEEASVRLRLIKVNDLSELEPAVDIIEHIKINNKYELSLCCEVLQRLPEGSRFKYIDQIIKLAERAVIFVPNRENRMHARLSGLDALSMDDLLNLTRHYGYVVSCGYIDMPPFPPGLKSGCAKKNATSVMRMLEIWCAFENMLPKIFKRKIAHIVYVYLRCNSC